MWWEFHRLLDLSPEQLVDEDDPIGLLTPVGPVDDERKGKQVWRYAFPAQDFDVWRGDAFDPDRKAERPGASPWDWLAGEVVAIDAADLTVDIRRELESPHPRAVVPLPWFRTAAHQERLIEIGEWVAEHDIDAAGSHRAARDLLMGRPPRAGQPPGTALATDDESDLAAARRLVTTLDQTLLAIQGPPGSGKTYSGARMICTLLASGQARRDHRHQPQGHRQPAPRGARCRRGRGRRCPAGPARVGGAGARGRAGRPREER